MRHMHTLISYPKTHAHTNIIPEEYLWTVCLWRKEDNVGEHRQHAEEEVEEGME